MESTSGDLSSQDALLQWRFDIERGTDEARKHSGWHPRNLRKAGFEPATLVDVGVGYGTPALYGAFGDAYRVLIEPLEEWRESLERWTEGGSGEYHLTAVGAEPGKVTFNVDRECLLMSSAYDASWLTSDRVDRRKVEMTTLDLLLDSQGWKPPFGLKIDTEGYECQVVAGAGRLLEDTQFVLAEIAVQRYESRHSFAEFVALMDDHRFEVCDIVDGRKGPDFEVFNLDLLFRKAR
jgi:FkbM family methyltransferase